MSEKIKWYQEVLALEPNSKVFFPLARMLADENNVDEAIDVLRHGLERHREFLEARLFLIELLYASGDQAACTEEIENLTKMFSVYAGFWQAWATVATVKNSSDVATIIRLLAASFQNKSLTLHEVIEKGLGHCETRQDIPIASVEPTDEVPTISDVDVQDQTAIADVSSEPEVTGDNSESLAEDEEQFTLRTRSMAEVLAEQGDVKGALDIYQELMDAATTSEEQADLNQRIATLRSHLTAPEQVPQQAAFPAGKDKLINMLETLAARVEARAQN